MTNNYEHLLIPLAFIIWRKREKPEAGGGACLHPAKVSREEPTGRAEPAGGGADWRQHAIVASPMIGAHVWPPGVEGPGEGRPSVTRR